MSCFHPLLALVEGEKNNGKKNIRFIKDYEKYRKSYYDSIGDFLLIPCGKCRGCRLDKSREWADRCMLEMQYHDSGYFVTLTYNDDHLPTTYFGDSYTGECVSSHTLYLRDVQTWLKRLRKSHYEKYGKGFRYFIAGEYGDNPQSTKRPHYHAILFGLCLDDLKPYKRSKHGFMYYTSEWLNDSWRFDKDKTEGDDPDIIPRPSGSLGYVVVADLSWQTCAYTARYTTKKLYGPASEYYTSKNLKQPFCVMSRNPGIGSQYLVDNFDSVLNENKIYLPGKDGSIEISRPRYFVRKILDIDPSAGELLKEKNSLLAKERILKREADSGRPIFDLLLDDEIDLESRTLCLHRDTV